MASANYDGSAGLLHGSLTLKNTTLHAFATQYRTIVLDNKGNWQGVSEWATTPEFASFDPNEIVNVPFSINGKQDTNFMIQINYEISGQTQTFYYTRKAIEENFGPIGFVAPTVTPTPTAVPTIAYTPAPTQEPTYTLTPQPTITPTQQPTPTATSSPTPTATPAPLADLVFGNVKSIAGEWGEDYKDGKKDYRVELDVSNLGNIGSGAFYVSAPGLEQKLRFDGIEPGKALPVAFDLKLPTGKNSIDVVIEAENKANEKGGNNSYNVVINVPEPPFKLVCDGCTGEEEYNKFFDIALNDYRHVLGVYGINEKDARMVVSPSKKGGVGFDFYINGKHGINGGYMSDFTPDPTDRGHKHEMAHAVNHTLFSTKNDLIIDIEPWYNTFDEGSAQYASGEVESAKLRSALLREDDGSMKNYNVMDAIELAASNPSRFWERVDSPDNAGWLTGMVQYLLLEREGLTPEKHAVAMEKLAEYYKEPGAKTNRERIQDSYESALGKKLDDLFNGLDFGIKRFYTPPSLTPTPSPQ